MHLALLATNARAHVVVPFPFAQVFGRSGAICGVFIVVCTTRQFVYVGLVWRDTLAALYMNVVHDIAEK